ncbi:MAG TPA: hypothetical protein VHC96_00385 [Puia sp.]|jgi:hypothetical protein|nr:hypothetical protein [Puia sp.]
MENKNMKYGLIGGTVIVWGLIVYRVSAGLSGPDVSPAPAPKPHVTAPVPRNDSFVLYADYPDPFIPEKDSLDEIDLKKNVTAAPGSPGGISGAVPSNGGQPGAMTGGPKPPTALETLKSILQYEGMVGNASKKLKIAIVTLHGQEQLVREKEKVDEIIIKKIERDRIGVVYKGRYFEVLRQEK